jgi:hypothetical protein
MLLVVAADLHTLHPRCFHRTAGLPRTCAVGHFGGLSTGRKNWRSSEYVFLPVMVAHLHSLRPSNIDCVFPPSDPCWISQPHHRPRRLQHCSILIYPGPRQMDLQVSLPRLWIGDVLLHRVLCGRPTHQSQPQRMAQRPIRVPDCLCALFWTCRRPRRRACHQGGHNQRNRIHLHLHMGQDVPSLFLGYLHRFDNSVVCVH